MAMNDDTYPSKELHLGIELIQQLTQGLLESRQFYVRFKYFYDEHALDGHEAPHGVPQEHALAHAIVRAVQRRAVDLVIEDETSTRDGQALTFDELRPRVIEVVCRCALASISETPTA